MRLNSQRHLFDIPDEVAYLNCAYMGPLSRAVREAGQEGVARKSQPWRIRPSDFFEETETARTLFGELIGADAEGIAIVPSASYGIGVAAANLSARPGQRIVLLDGDAKLRTLPAAVRSITRRDIRPSALSACLLEREFGALVPCSLPR